MFSILASTNTETCITNIQTSADGFLGPSWSGCQRSDRRVQCSVSWVIRRVGECSHGRWLTLSLSSFSLSALASFSFLSISTRSSRVGLKEELGPSVNQRTTQPRYELRGVMIQQHCLFRGFEFCWLPRLWPRNAAVRVNTQYSWIRFRTVGIATNKCFYDEAADVKGETAALTDIALMNEDQRILIKHHVCYPLFINYAEDMLWNTCICILRLKVNHFYFLHSLYWCLSAC